MMIAKLLQDAAATLSSVSDTALLDAEILLSHVLSLSRSSLRARSTDNLTASQIQDFNTLVRRRLDGDPVAYLIGHKEFWSLDLCVNQDTLIPRPETELLVEVALQLFPDASQHLKAADLGTGSGAIALALASERKAWEIYAVDNSETALRVAADNAHRLQINNISFHCGDWFTALPVQQLDLVVSNPPYLSEQEWPVYADNLKYEPRTALVAAENGLQAIREITTAGCNYIRSGGYLLIEHGFMQGLAVRELFSAAGYVDVQTKPDFSGRERLTIGRVQ